MKRTEHLPCLYILSLLACFGVFLFALTAGETFLSLPDIFRIVFRREEGPEAGIFFYARLPRAAGACLSGCALSVAGAVLQKVLDNPLASPGIIGVNAGAGLGVTVCCALGFLSGWAISAFAFLGSLVAVLSLVLFAGKTGASRTTVILSGVAANGILGAVSESITVLDPDVATLTTEFRVGGFSSVSGRRLLPCAVIILLTLAVLFTLFNELDIVALGDETARSIGLRVNACRLLLLILSSLLSAAAVSFSGLLGFVGLIVPHGVRKLVGGESRRLIPLSAILGAAFVCLCDTLARLLFLPYELPVGLLTAVIGGPLFVLILVRTKGGHRHA